MKKRMEFQRPTRAAFLASALVFAVAAVSVLAGFTYGHQYGSGELAVFIRSQSVASKLTVGFVGTLAAVVSTVVFWRMARKSFREKNTREDGPPQLAELLVCVFARAKDIDGLMGDLQERFERDSAAGMSQHRAKTRYWGRVARSLLPQMWQFAKRIGLYGLIASSLRR